ncbi:MAG: single-stranded DNA-binding protein [Gammaproteobacteria bacterium]
MTAASRKSLNASMRVAQSLGRDVDRLEFNTPSHVYNPLRYAWPAFGQYLQRYGVGRGRVLLLGMNPGPWGMAQTGVPFGEVRMVRDWLRIEAPLRLPLLPDQHPKYPIRGFDCPRSEGSGSRFWGWTQQRFGSPENFFERFFVWNYCPLLFLADGRNLIPGKLRVAEAAPLLTACDKALTALLRAIEPSAVVGIGRYAEARAWAVAGKQLPIGFLPHPSPANPAANRNWPALAEAALAPWMKSRPAR